MQQSVILWTSLIVRELLRSLDGRRQATAGHGALPHKLGPANRTTTTATEMQPHQMSDTGNMTFMSFDVPIEYKHKVKKNQSRME